VNRARWIFLPLGLCALAAVGAHAAADVIATRLVHIANRVDTWLAAFSLTAPLADIVSAQQRTWVSRALALCCELLADGLVALPLLGYDERAGKEELKLARGFVKKLGYGRLLRPAAAAMLCVAGASAVARLMRGTLLHFPFIAGLLGATVLFSLLAIFLPRAAFRFLERESQRRKPSRVALLFLLPMAIAAVAAFRT
jgi:hypothetical protein